MEGVGVVAWGEALAHLRKGDVVGAGHLLDGFFGADAEHLADDLRRLLGVRLHVGQAVEIALDHRLDGGGLLGDHRLVEDQHVGDQPWCVLGRIDHLEFVAAAHGEDLRDVGLVGHADRQVARGHGAGDAFRGHVDGVDVLVAHAVLLQRVGEQEVRGRQRIEADLLAFEVGDRLDRGVGDDGVTAVGEVDGHHHPVLEALGDRGHHLIVGEHAAVQCAADHGGGNQRRIVEELQLHVQVVGLEQVELVGDVEGAIAGPDHGADLQLLGGLGGQR